MLSNAHKAPSASFVVLSAIFLGWWQAAAVALVSTAILGGLFYAPDADLLETSCFLSGAGIFLASSAMMVGIVSIARRLIAGSRSSGADESSGGIFFSLEEGQVWASWYGQGPPVRLGSQKRVSEMMEDFLKQVELGKRLTDRSR